MSPVRTPSQTVGPYYAIGLSRRDENVLDPDGIELRGTLFDGQGDPIPDGLVEVWDAVGRRWGRRGTQEEAGGFRFLVPRDAGVLEAFVFARGMLRHERTRIYLRAGDDEVWNGLDDDQRATLLARRDGDSLVFDIRMQGEHATVFFEH
jgi:protocatechuate 3,4-dioxygenase alpha subunit